MNPRIGRVIRVANNATMQVGPTELRYFPEVGVPGQSVSRSAVFPIFALQIAKDAISTTTPGKPQKTMEPIHYPRGSVFARNTAQDVWHYYEDGIFGAIRAFLHTIHTEGVDHEHMVEVAQTLLGIYHHLVAWSDTSGTRRTAVANRLVRISKRLVNARNEFKVGIRTISRAGVIDSLGRVNVLVTQMRRHRAAEFAKHRLADIHGINRRIQSRVVGLGSWIEDLRSFAVAYQRLLVQLHDDSSQQRRVPANLALLRKFNASVRHLVQPLNRLLITLRFETGIIEELFEAEHFHEASGIITQSQIAMQVLVWWLDLESLLASVSCFREAGDATQYAAWQQEALVLAVQLFDACNSIHWNGLCFKPSPCVTRTMQMDLLGAILCLEEPHFDPAVLDDATNYLKGVSRVLR